MEDANFTVQRGKTLGLVGESGSGKTVSALAVMGLLPAKVSRVAGSIRFEGQELTSLEPGRPAQAPRERHRHDLPGAHDQPEPGVHGG